MLNATNVSEIQPQSRTAAAITGLNKRLDQCFSAMDSLHDRLGYVLKEGNSVATDTKSGGVTAVPDSTLVGEHQNLDTRLVTLCGYIETLTDRITL